MEKQTLEIAKTILGQIKCLDRDALTAWGAINFVALGENNEFQGGVRCKVNGLTFKGWLAIELTWTDEYKVSFVNKKAKVEKEYEGVYCDMLVNIVDYVEGKHAA